MNYLNSCKRKKNNDAQIFGEYSEKLANLKLLHSQLISIKNPVSMKLTEYNRIKIKVLIFLFSQTDKHQNIRRHIRIGYNRTTNVQLQTPWEYIVEKQEPKNMFKASRNPTCQLQNDTHRCACHRTQRSGLDDPRVKHFVIR